LLTTEKHVAGEGKLNIAQLLQQPPSPTRTAAKVPDVSQFKATKLFSQRDRHKIQQWRVRKEMLQQQMEDWRNMITKDAAIFLKQEQLYKMGSLSDEERMVALMIFETTDDNQDSHISREEISEFFECDTEQATELFGDITRLVNVMYQPMGFCLAEWFDFLRKMKGSRGATNLHKWFKAVGEHLAAKPSNQVLQIEEATRDLGVTALLKQHDEGPIQKTLRHNETKRATEAKQVTLERHHKSLARVAAWEEKEMKRKVQAGRLNPRVGPLRILQPPTGANTVPMPHNRSHSVELDPDKRKAMATGIHARAPSLPESIPSKPKLKRRKAPKFQAPSPLLPSRLQLSPLAAKIMAPRDQPFSEAQVHGMAQHVHQTRVARHATDPSLCTQAGDSTWSTPPQWEK